MSLAMDDRGAAIYVAGHRGLVGSALVRRLQRAGYTNLLVRTHAELDLANPQATDAFFASARPAYVFVAAAKVGGIRANDVFAADFLRVNLQIQTNVLGAAQRHGVTKLLFLGSSCIYPARAPQPMREEYLLSGALEPTNKAYAVAKIAGIVACEMYNKQYGTCFIAAMPSNLYGPGDNFDLEHSHVLPAMLRKLHEAKARGAAEVELWGSGKPRREFLYSDDLADACLFLMQRYAPSPELVYLNVGVGEDITIAELAALVAELVGFRGKIRWNTAMPDGVPRKLLDVSRLTRLGWRATTPLADGVRRTYAWFRARPQGAPP